MKEKIKSNLKDKSGKFIEFLKFSLKCVLHAGAIKKREKQNPLNCEFLDKPGFIIKKIKNNKRERNRKKSHTVRGLLFAEKKVWKPLEKK